jgi:hypothetical protein
LQQWVGIYDRLAEIQNCLDCYVRAYQNVRSQDGIVVTDELFQLQIHIEKLKAEIAPSIEVRQNGNEPPMPEPEILNNRRPCFRMVWESWKQLERLREPVVAVMENASRSYVGSQIRPFLEARRLNKLACIALKEFILTSLDLGSRMGTELFGEKKACSTVELEEGFNSNFPRYLKDVGLCRKDDHAVAAPRGPLQSERA